MKFLIAMFLLVSSASAGPVDPYWPFEPNQLALNYADRGPGGPNEYLCATSWNASTVRIDILLFAPSNPDYAGDSSRDVSNINGFECRIETSPNLSFIAWDFPVPAINIGSGAEAVVGYAEPIPITGDFTVLASFELLVYDFDIPPGPVWRYFSCHESYNAWIKIEPLHSRQSIPGSVAYLDADDPDDPLVAGAVRDAEDMFFTIYPEQVVAIEGQTWGTLKALYR